MRRVGVCTQMTIPMMVWVTKEYSNRGNSNNKNSKNSNRSSSSNTAPRFSLVVLCCSRLPASPSVRLRVHQKMQKESNAMKARPSNS